jgi:HD-GYP domain-containing protein (c-di-GMP phosphodiesterase class II)
MRLIPTKLCESIIEDPGRRCTLGKISDLFGNSPDKTAKSLESMTIDCVKCISMIIDDLSVRKDDMIMLMNVNVVLTEPKQFFCQNALNTSVYAVKLGMAQGFRRSELMALGMGALLHDVGNALLPIQLLSKCRPLTTAEFAEIRKHTELGYRLLKDIPGIPLAALRTAAPRETGRNRVPVEDEGN